MPTTTFLSGFQDALQNHLAQQAQMLQYAHMQNEQGLEQRRMGLAEREAAPNEAFGQMYGQVVPQEQESQPNPNWHAPMLDTPENPSSVGDPTAQAHNEMRTRMITALGHLPAHAAESILHDALAFHGQRMMAERMGYQYGPGGLAEQRIGVANRNADTRERAVAGTENYRITVQAPMAQARVAHWGVEEQNAADRLGLSREEFEALKGHRSVTEKQGQDRIDRPLQLRGSQGERTTAQMVQNGQWDDLLKATDEHRMLYDETGQSVPTLSDNARTAMAALEGMSPGIMKDYQAAKEARAAANGAYFGKAEKRAAADAADAKLEQRFSQMHGQPTAPQPTNPQSARNEQIVPKPAAPAGAPVKIGSDEEFHALPAGTVFVGPDGVKRTKP